MNASGPEHELSMICQHFYCRHAMGRFGKERMACPLLLAASAPEATVDRSLYTPPALRCLSSFVTSAVPTRQYCSKGYGSTEWPGLWQWLSCAGSIDGLGMWVHYHSFHASHPPWVCCLGVERQKLIDSQQVTDGCIYCVTVSAGCAGLAAAGGTQSMGRPGSTGECRATPCKPSTQV